MEDSRIIALYQERREQAIAETERKYGRYCRYIANRILSSDEDAEEIASDTYFKIWNTIPPNRPASLKAYVGMIARQLSLDAYEARCAQKRGAETALILDELSECISGNDDGAEFSDTLALREALNKFVRSLPEKTQKIFVRRYFYASPVSEIARDYHMKESSVTVLMLRIRKKLKIFLKKEGFDI